MLNLSLTAFLILTIIVQLIIIHSLMVLHNQVYRDFKELKNEQIKKGGQS